MATLRHALDAILVDYEIKGQRTSYRQEGCYEHLAKHFGWECDLATLGYSQILAYVKVRLDQGAAHSTIRNETNALKRGFNLLEYAGEAKRPRFPTIRVSNVRKGFLEDEHFTAIHRHLPEDLKPFFHFLYLTGWRTGDAIGLTWNGNIDFLGGVVRIDVGVTKCGEGRTFPFSVLPELRACLLDQHKRTKDLEIEIGKIVPWVFWRRPDGHAIVNYRDGGWVDAAAKAGLSELIPHDMRRSAVRNLERAGVPRSVAMKLTGHRTESVYTRYAISNEADLADGVKKLAEWKSRWQKTKKEQG